MKIKMEIRQSIILSISLYLLITPMAFDYTRKYETLSVVSILIGCVLFVYSIMYTLYKNEI